MNDDTNFLSSDHPSNLDRRRMWPDLNERKRSYTFTDGFVHGVMASFVVFCVCALLWGLI